MLNAHVPRLHQPGDELRPDRWSLPGRVIGHCMLPLYEDAHFTFRFADDRTVPRIHLASVESGRRVAVYRIDPATGNRLGLLAEGVAGTGGWVELCEPIVVRAGEGFIAVPDPPLIRESASPPCEAPPGHWGEDDPPAPAQPATPVG
jgi:hypothetical protein